MRYFFLSIILSLFASHGFVADDQSIQSAYHSKISDIQVESSGVVVKILPDDNKGSRHQKFILELATGDTVLVAHNIDLTQG